MKKELWSVEWSKSQKCFHIDFLEDTIQRNVNHLLHKDKEVWISDYIIIGIFPSYKEGDNFISKIRKELNISTLAETFLKEHCS